MAVDKANIRDHVTGKMDFKLQGLIKTLSLNLYQDPWVALRELIQNAHDACVVRRAPIGEGNLPKDPEAPPAFIRIYYDRYRRELVIEDNGTGLTWEEAKQSLTVIGYSTTDQIRSRLEEIGQLAYADQLIGRFGLGLLSAFIIARRVEFETRSYQPEAETIWWSCDGGSDYELGRLDFAREPGTKITVEVDQDHLYMFNDADRLKEMVRRYADLLKIPIYFGEHGYDQINTMDAPWDHEGSDSEYEEFIRQRFPNESVLHVIPVEVNEPPGPDQKRGLRLGGALFIPRQEKLDQIFTQEYGTVEVYVRRMFVTQDESKLLPKWAKFVKGVIDSPDLSETVSRESIRHDDENFVRAQKVLGRLILENLQQLAERNTRLFREIAHRYNLTIKVMALEEPELFDAIKDLVFFKVGNTSMSLATYFEKTEKTPQAAEQTGDKRRIYYSSNVLGLGQHAFLFAKKGWLLIDAASYPDEPFLMAYAERYKDQVELVALDAAGDQVFTPLEPKEDKWRALEDAFAYRRIMATVVRYEPEDIPAVLVEARESEMSDEQLERILREQNLEGSIKNFFLEIRDLRNRQKRWAVGGGTTLYLNANSEIIRLLADRDPYDPETIDVMTVLYNNALMLSQKALSPDTARVIFDGNNYTLKNFLARGDEIRKLKSQGPDIAQHLREQAEEYKARAAEEKAKALELSAKTEVLTQALSQKEEELGRLRTQVAAFEKTQACEQPLSDHIVCFVGMPFVFEGFFKALQMVLEVAPYFWEVRWAREYARDAYVSRNVQKLIDTAHCYIFEISDTNPNVMAEAGYAYWRWYEGTSQPRPLLLLRQKVKNKANPEGEDKVITDFGNFIILDYSPGNNDLTKVESSENLEKILKNIVVKQPDFSRLRGAKHYMSKFLSPTGVDPVLFDQIRSRFKTIEDYCQAFKESPDDIGIERPLAEYLNSKLVTYIQV